MTDRDWKRAGPWLERLLDLPPEERAAYLARECEDEELAADLLRLVEEEERDAAFLEPPPAPEAVPPVESVGPYKLDRRLGEGGMGEVWLAHRSDDFEQHVAVKFVRPGAASREAVERFQRERQVLAALEHPGIARLLDGGTLPEGRPYLVLDYVDGVPIDRHCAERRLSIRARLTLLLDVLDAVESAHRRLVVHRDLKPSNILVDGEGRVRLLDFGIAKLLDESMVAGQTRTDALPMTPRYASPEQVEGRAISTRSDVYSLGVLAYELICGRSPYGEATTSMALVRAVCETDPAPPGTVFRALSQEDRRTFSDGGRRRGGVDRELDWIVMTALRKDPERRYASVERMADDLRRYLDGQPVLAGPDSWAYRFRKFASRNRWAVVAAGAAVVGLLAGTVVSLLAAARAERSATREREARKVSQETLAFMTEVFGSANPQTGGSREVRLIEVLEEAAQRGRTLDPAARFNVLWTVASVHSGIGEYETAERLAAECLELARTSDLPPVDVARVEYMLGFLAGESGRSAEAVEFLEAGLQKIDDESPGFLTMEKERDNIRMSLKMALAGAVQTSDPVRSLELYEAAIEGHVELFGADHPDTLLARFNIAGFHLSRGLVSQAVEGFRLVFEGYSRMQGPEAFGTLVGAYGLAVAELIAGRPSEALDLAREYEPVAASILGEDSDWTLQLKLAEGWALQELGDFEEGARLTEPLLARGILNRDHHVLGERVVAVCNRELGRLEEANELLRACVERVADDLDFDRVTAGLLLYESAVCLERLGRDTEARLAAQRAVDAFRTLSSMDFPVARDSTAMLERLSRP